MHHSSTVRPYAKAIFDVATQQNQMQQWQQYLQAFAAALSEDTLRASLQHPAWTPAKTAELIVSVLADLGIQDNSFQRLMILLAQYRRLALLPALLAELQVLVDVSMRRQRVVIESAFKLSAKSQAKLTDWLAKKYNKEIVATVSVVPDLIGGARIRVGDQVIDLSVRGQLQRLKRQLMH